MMSETRSGDIFIAEQAFDFVLALDGVHELSTPLEDALFDAGCDATLSARAGRVTLHFTRTAPSFDDAVQSALRDVEKAHLTARLA